MNNIPFIAVEGPIGVGKTSLSRLIAKEFGSFHLKEIVEENPFLGKFYEDSEEWSFQTEMFFLCNRFKQLNDVNKHYLKQGKSVVADYHVFKNSIFAERTLHDLEYQKYMKVYGILTEDMIKPNVVIYLNASIETLMKRIGVRGRSFEENMDPAYLQQLSTDYEVFMDTFKQQNPDVPVLYFSGDQYDFVNKKEDLQFILNEIGKSLKKQLV